VGGGAFLPQAIASSATMPNGSCQGVHSIASAERNNQGMDPHDTAGVAVQQKAAESFAT
jgi:phosphoribosylformylglycinamidine (FGAM) synthase-like amidotransferase family enzyme